MEFLISIFTSRPLSPAYIQSLNLSYNNFANLPGFYLFPLETLTRLEVKDNRLSFLPASMRCLKGLQEVDLRNNQLKKLDVVRELPNLRKLLVEGNPLTLEEIRSLIRHVDKTTRTIFVDIAGSVTCICGNKSFPYSSLSFCRRVEIQIGDSVDSGLTNRKKIWPQTFMFAPNWRMISFFSFIVMSLHSV